MPVPIFIYLYMYLYTSILYKVPDQDRSDRRRFTLCQVTLQITAQEYQLAVCAVTAEGRQRPDRSKIWIAAEATTSRGRRRESQSDYAETAHSRHRDWGDDAAVVGKITADVTARDRRRTRHADSRQAENENTEGAWGRLSDYFIFPILNAKHRYNQPLPSLLNVLPKYEDSQTLVSFDWFLFIFLLAILKLGIFHCCFAVFRIRIVSDDMDPDPGSAENLPKPWKKLSLEILFTFRII